MTKMKVLPMTTDVTVNVVDGEPDWLEDLNWRLVSFNKQMSGWGSHYFAVELRDPSGALRGGAGVRVNLGAAEVFTLWTDGEVRGGGNGRLIMETAMREGARLGATKVLLDTYDFQARAFYESLGFEVFGQFDYPSGNKRFYLMRDI